MNLNATLMGQMLTFALFVWFTMKFVWPPLMQAMRERQGKIADGLAAAERGHQELALAQQKSVETLRTAKQDASSIVEQANKRASQIVEEAKAKAREEADRIVELAQQEVAQEVMNAKTALRTQVAQVAVAGAEKILRRSIDQTANSDILQSVIEDIK